MQPDQNITEDELLKSFRPRDRKHVEPPKWMKFPCPLGHYLAWTEPSGVRIFLVFMHPVRKSPIGIAFRRDQQGSLGSAAGVCDWCHDHGPSDRIGLLTATVDSKKRVGVSLCLDLSCVQKLESIANVTGQDLGKMTERLKQRMVRFAEEALEMGLD